MTKNQKLSLYIKSSNLNHVGYKFSKAPDESYSDSKEHLVAIYNIPNNRVFNLSVDVTELVEGAHLLIEKITLDGEQLNHIDSFGIYKTSHGVKRTNGYMDKVGAYHFKIRFNFFSQNYLNFLLSDK